jgi:hypothetical protein
LLPLKRNANLAVNKDVLIAEQALPSILSSNTLSHRVVTEIKHHHRWFGILFYYSAAFPRVLRVTSLATNVIIMLFIQSITYSLTNPDDGSCEMLLTETDCLDPRSPFATGTPKCFWDGQAQRCGFVEPDSDVKIILFVAIFSALLCTPMALLVDWLIMNVLAAPTRQRVQPTTSLDAGNGVDSSTLRVGDSGSPRRRGAVQKDPLQNATAVVPTGSNATSAVVAARKGTLRALFGSVIGIGGRNSVISDAAQLKAQSDMRRLVADLLNYRDALTTEERIEFDGK